MLSKIFNLCTLFASIILGVGCWFLVDYVDPYSVESALLETVKIFAMLAVFGACFFAILCLLVMPFRAVFGSKKA